MSDGKLLNFVKQLSLLLEQKPNEEVVFTQSKI